MDVQLGAIYNIHLFCFSFLLRSFVVFGEVLLLQHLLIHFPLSPVKETFVSCFSIAGIHIQVSN
jgi:hypothetical protein